MKPVSPEPQEHLRIFAEKNAPPLDPWNEKSYRTCARSDQLFSASGMKKVMNAGWDTFGQ